MVEQNGQRLRLMKGAVRTVAEACGLQPLALVEQGRTIYQRILTWIINKVVRTILKAAFVAIVYVATGKFFVSAVAIFAMLLLTFPTDFAKVRQSPGPSAHALVADGRKVLLRDGLMLGSKRRPEGCNEQVASSKAP